MEQIFKDPHGKRLMDSSFIDDENSEEIKPPATLRDSIAMSVNLDNQPKQ